MINEKDEWGNIELPGFGDDKLLSPNLNKRLANQAKAVVAKIEGKYKGEKNGRYGKPVTEKTRKILSEKNTGRVHGEEHRRKSARPGILNGMYSKGELVAGEKNGFYGKTHDNETTLHLSQIAKNRIKDHHCEHCNEYYTAQAYKQHHGDYCEHNPNRIVKERKKMAKQICPHCGKEAAPKCFARLHGDNCKNK